MAGARDAAPFARFCDRPTLTPRIDAALAIDGIHTDYVDGKPGPLESKLGTANLEIWLQVLARDAIAGRKRAMVTHSEIFPGTFASTTETADYLIRELHLERRAVLKWGPMGIAGDRRGAQGQVLLIRASPATPRPTTSTSFTACPRI